MVFQGRHLTIACGSNVRTELELADIRTDDSNKVKLVAFVPTFIRKQPI